MDGRSITDVAGQGAAPLQLERICNRYLWAREFCRGGTVLEVACGTGQGLSLLASLGANVIGSDSSAENLEECRATYGPDAALVRLDAHALPFPDESFSSLAVLEGVYFFASPSVFFREAARTLVSGGNLLVSVINKDRMDFLPNAHYTMTFGAPELATAMRNAGLQVDTFGALPEDESSLGFRLFGGARRILARVGLVPDSMQLRLLLKRLVYGKLQPMPRILQVDSARYRPPVRIDDSAPDRIHQVILCRGVRTG
jgi:SAM-dependent methyltransferase